MAQQTLDQVKGSDRDYQLNLLTEDGEPATGFVDSDAITAEIWGGGDTAALVSPACVWIDAAAGTLKLTISAADVADLEAQPYPIRVSIDHSGRSILAWEGWLKLRAAPGSTMPVPVYCTYRDMLDLAGDWLDRLAMESTYSGFRRGGGRARETLDNWILARYRPPRFGSYDLATVGDWGAAEGPDPWLRDQLAADAARVTSRVVQIAAYLSLAYICDKQHEDDYAGKAVVYHRKARSLAGGLVAEIAAAASGYAVITIPLGVFNTRTN